MCAQQTAADMPSAGLNITELADQYTRPVRGIGHQYRLTREEQDDAAQSTWLALCQNADQIRDPRCIRDGWPPRCADSPPRPSAADTANPPPRIG